MDECVERDQNWTGERTERILKEGVGLTLIVESRGGKGRSLGQSRVVMKVDVSIRPGGEAGGNEKSRIHSSPAARQGQADRRGPRGGSEINGSGQAGGAISRIGWGCMREIPPVETLRQTIGRVNQGRGAPRNEQQSPCNRACITGLRTNF